MFGQTLRPPLLDAFFSLQALGVIQFIDNLRRELNEITIRWRMIWLYSQLSRNEAVAVADMAVYAKDFLKEVECMEGSL